MGCDCGKPKCDGHCGVSPAVLQINNPSECVLFHRVEVPASMGDSKINPPKNGAYKNVLLFYEADQTSWLYSSDGIPQKLVNGLTNYEDAINLPQINGVTLVGNKSLGDLGITDAIDDAVAEEKTEREAADEAIQDELLSRAVVFDTVADMKQATNLVNGSYARTLGFHSINDGGGAIYKITDTGIANEIDVIAINGLYATYVNLNKIVTPEQFGAYGDGLHNDTDALRTAVTYAGVVSLRPVKYRVALSADNQSVLSINKDNFVLEGHDGVIELANNNYPHYIIINLLDCKNFHIKDVELIGDRKEHDYSGGGTHEFGYGVFINTAYDSLQTSEMCYGTLENVKIHDMTGDAVCTKNGYATGTIKVLNSELYKCRRQGISVLDSDTIIVRGSYIHEIGLTQDGIAGTSPTSGIDLEPVSGTTSINYVLVENCIIDTCYRYSIVNGGNNTTKIEVKNTKLGRPLNVISPLTLDNVDLDFADSASFYASNTDFGSSATGKDFRYSTITVRGANKQYFNGHHLHVKGVIINDTWGMNNAPKLPPSSNIYDSIFEKMLITTGDANTDINGSVLNNNLFVSCQFHNSGKALVFTNCTFIGCTKYSFNTSTQRTFINCYFDAIPDANMKYKGCYLLDGTAITDNL